MPDPSRAALLLAAAVMVSGCLGAPAGHAPASPPAGGPWAAVAFAAPTTVHEGGYEPGIKVAPDGTLFLHAHKSSVSGDGSQMSSYLWWSRDAGATWTPVPSPAGVRETAYTFEGDVAFDQAGHVFFVDNTLADEVVSRWRLTDAGPVWESTVPFAGTDGSDDRPWLEASGDGHLVLISKSLLLAGPRDLAAGRTGFASYRIYVSDDAGATWSQGLAFPGSEWCDLAMDPTAPAHLTVLCEDRDPVEPGAPAMALYASTDGGATWTREDLGGLRAGMADRFPSVATGPDGTSWAAWIDDDPSDDATASLHVARRGHDGAAAPLDGTAFNGTMQRPWVCAGPGVVAIVFYGTTDVVPGAASEWHAYAEIASDPEDALPHWTLALVDPAPVAVRDASPADFFQCTVDQAGAVHVAYLRESGPPLPVAATYGGTILHAVQSSGANLATKP